MQKFSESIGTQINIVARAMKNCLERELAKIGVSPSQWMLLTALGERNKQVQTDLARMVNLDNATVTRIIDKLEEMKLLIRKQDKGDRRVQIVSLTPKGRSAYKKWNTVGEKVNSIATENLSATQLDNTLNLLAVVLKNLTNDKNNHH